MKPNHIDAARVWQRLSPPEPREQQTLQMLLQQLNRDSAYLMKLTKAGENPTLSLLIREYTDQSHCIRGIITLSGGSLPRNITGSPPDHSLSRCYDHALQRLSAWHLRSADPVYGPVFVDLAKQTARHCRCIAELLGSDPKESKIKGRS